MNPTEARSRFIATTFAPIWADLQARLQSDPAPASAKTLATAQAWLSLEKGEPNLWEAAKTLGTWANTPGLAADHARAAFAAIKSIREFQGEMARQSQVTTLVVFGTSGWREAIGEGFTVLNVRKTVRAIGEVMSQADYAAQNGFIDTAAVKKAGVLVFRDNRYLGDVFMQAACEELAIQGFKLYDAGMCPTGVGSALVKILGVAGSINFTPSHNPMEYAGIKFNPADGGPADVEWTSQIERRANAYMQGDGNLTFKPAPAAPATGNAAPVIVDAKSLFTRFVAEKSQVFNLQGIRDFLRARKNDLHLVIDFMHGSARGYVESLLGEDLVTELEAAGALERVNNYEDFAFHGVKPEPSATNQKPLIQKLKTSGRPLTLAVALDPDADRIRFADAELDVDMNRFGPIAFAHFVKRGLTGGLCTTVPSSGLAAAVAKRNLRPVFETAVGFKHFRPYLGTGKALMAFEESDGISFMGHTLEKCALAGFLAALEVMAQSGQTLSVQSRALESEYGFFHPAKGGVDLVGVTVEAWQNLKGKVMKALTQGLVEPGQSLSLGASGEKQVADVLTLDGLKVVFADGSWILLRASGTEPKFRFYVEWIDQDGKADSKALDSAYLQAAETLLAQARKQVEG